jgi:hypothetical protein
MVMKFMLLPWKPELVFTGTSVMGVNPENGKFCSHVVRFELKLSSSVVINGFNLWLSLRCILCHHRKLWSNTVNATSTAVVSGYRLIKNLDAMNVYFDHSVVEL